MLIFRLSNRRLVEHEMELFSYSILNTLMVKPVLGRNFLSEPLMLLRTAV